MIIYGAPLKKKVARVDDKLCLYGFHHFSIAPWSGRNDSSFKGLWLHFFFLGNFTDNYLNSLKIIKHHPFLFPILTNK